jgi:lipoprotein-anchoring transpeptidase ErfK/SrfK
VKKVWIWSAAGVAVLLALGVIIKMSGVPRRGATAVSEPAPAASSDKYEDILKAAAALEAQGELVRARQAYKEVMGSSVSRPGIADVQKKYEDLNMRVILSAISVPNETEVYVVKPGDSLSAIASRYRTTVEFLKKQNGLTSDTIRPDMRLRVWTGKFSVMVDKSQNLLFLQSNGEVVKTYPVSTGKNNITPVGSFKIINKLVEPDWTHDGKIIPYGNPQNILGTRWLGFDLPGYGIHGTSEPESIGTQATAGCVRMINSDVEQLFDLLPRGTEVTIND